MGSFGLWAASAGAALAACLLVLMTASEPAWPTVPWENGNIAYSGWDGSDYEIYTISPNGGTPINVTDNTKDDYSPSFSPDSQKIAYQGQDGSDFEIYTIPSSGGTPTNVTNNTMSDAYPDWGVEVNATPPTVASVKPADGKTRVRRGTNITATFSEEMNPDTLTDSTIFLTNTKTGGAVKAEVSCDDPCTTVTINPWKRMARNTRYKAVITKGAKDLSGHAMEERYAWTFRTRAR